MITDGTEIFEHTDLSDRELCDMIRQGNSEALSVLLHRYSSAVKMRAKTVYCRGLDCDDLYQEGMISLIRAAVTYSDEKNAAFKTYAFVCVTNRYRDLIRKSGGDSALVSLDEADLPQDNDPVSQVMIRDELERLRSVMENDLSEKEKRIILDHLAGLSYSEIARKHGCDVKSVNNTLCRVRKKLKQF